MFFFHSYFLILPPSNKSDQHVPDIKVLLDMTLAMYQEYKIFYIFMCKWWIRDWLQSTFCKCFLWFSLRKLLQIEYLFLIISLQLLILNSWQIKNKTGLCLLLLTLLYMVRYYSILDPQRRDQFSHFSRCNNVLYNFLYKQW